MNRLAYESGVNEMLNGRTEIDSIAINEYGMFLYHTRSLIDYTDV